MHKIHKLPVLPQKSVYVLPHAADIIAFCEDGNGQLCIWYRFHDNNDPNTSNENRKLSIFGTGHKIPDEYDYVATAVCGSYVWHLHETTVVVASVHDIGASNKQTSDFMHAHQDESSIDGPDLRCGECGRDDFIDEDAVTEHEEYCHD